MNLPDRFAPGASPFHIKGVVFRNVLDYLDRELPGGRAKMIAELRDEPVRKYLQQPFLASSWYDVVPFVAFCNSIAVVKRVPLLPLVRELAREQAQRDTKGVYKMLLKLVSPETVLERAPRAAQQYFDFVTSAGERVGPYRWRMTGSGIPEFAAPVYMAVTEAFLLHALMLAGARDPVHRWLPSAPAGVREGIPLVQVTREIEWR